MPDPKAKPRRPLQHLLADRQSLVEMEWLLDVEIRRARDDEHKSDPGRRTRK